MSFVCSCLMFIMYLFGCLKSGIIGILAESVFHVVFCLPLFKKYLLLIWLFLTTQVALGVLPSVSFILFGVFCLLVCSFALCSTNVGGSFGRLKSIFDDPGGVGVFAERVFHVRLGAEPSLADVSAHLVKEKSERLLGVFVKRRESRK